jgi:hypothetical protein
VSLAGRQAEDAPPRVCEKLLDADRSRAPIHIVSGSTREVKSSHGGNDIAPDGSMREVSPSHRFGSGPRRGQGSLGQP